MGAGLLIQGNGMRALRGLGLDAAVAEAGTAVGRWVFADEVLVETDLEALWGALDHASALRVLACSRCWSAARVALPQAWHLDHLTSREQGASLRGSH